jgi:hypothetical protein
MMNGSKAAAKAVALDATLKKMIAAPPDRMAGLLLCISTVPSFAGESSSFSGNLRLPDRRIALRLDGSVFTSSADLPK